MQKAQSIFDLAFSFMEDFFTENPPDETKRQILYDIQGLLNGGWTSEEITKEFRHFNGSFPGSIPSIPEMFKGLRRNKTNLLVQGIYYYHNQLRIHPPAPKRSLDLNTGEIIKGDDEYYLEMRASYTIENLTDYFIKRSDGKAPQSEHKRFIGSFQYLLKSYSIEQVLFMIDAFVNEVESGDVYEKNFSPLTVKDYARDGEERLGQRRTEITMAGEDRIVPRRRVLSFRGGVPTGGHLSQELHADPGHLQGV